MSYMNPNIYSIHHKIRLNPLEVENTRPPSNLSYINLGKTLPIMINLKSNPRIPRSALCNRKRWNDRERNWQNRSQIIWMGSSYTNRTVTNLLWTPVINSRNPDFEEHYKFPNDPKRDFINPNCGSSWDPFFNQMQKRSCSSPWIKSENWVSRKTSFLNSTLSWFSP